MQPTTLQLQEADRSEGWYSFTFFFFSFRIGPHLVWGVLPIFRMGLVLALLGILPYAHTDVCFLVKSKSCQVGVEG